MPLVVVVVEPLANQVARFWLVKAGGKAALAASHPRHASETYFSLLPQAARRGDSRALCTAGSRSATSRPMIAITASSSTSVRPRRGRVAIMVWMVSPSRRLVPCGLRPMRCADCQSAPTCGGGRRSSRRGRYRYLPGRSHPARARSRTASRCRSLHRCRSRWCG